MNYSFEENEMPFDILERFGLTQTMIEDLPTDVLQNIYNGKKSPVLLEPKKAVSMYSSIPNLTSMTSNCSTRAKARTFLQESRSLDI